MVCKGALRMQHKYLLCITLIGLGLLSCTRTINALSMLERFNLNMNAGTLTLTFSEQVSANTLDPTRMTLQSSRTSGAVSIQLSSETTTSSANGPVILLELGNDADRIKASTQLATSITNTFLSLTASAIEDVNGSPVVSISPSNALQVSAFVPDTTQPELISFSLDLELGSLQLFFSEAVDHSTLNPTGITLLNSNPIPSRSFPLTGGSVVAVSLTEVMLTLATGDANNLRQLQDLATSVQDTYLVLASSTIQDYSANSVLAIPNSGAIRATQVIQDVGRPVADSFPVFDLNTGVLSISFSEPMNLSSIDVTQFTLFSDQSSPAAEAYTLTGGVLTSSNGSNVAIMLLSMDLNEIKLLQNLCTSVTNCIPSFTSQFGSDLEGNSVVALSPQQSQPFEEFVTDSTLPVLVSFALDLDVGTLILTFSEPVSVNTLDPMQIALQASQVSEVSVYLSNETITISGNGLVIVLQLQGDADVIKANTLLATSLDTTFLSLTSNAVEDLYGNPVDSVTPFSPILVTIYTPDMTSPELLWFILDLNVGYLNLSFSEAVPLSTFTPTGITLQNSTPNPTANYTLTGGDAIAGLTWVRLLLTTNDANELRRFQDLATSVEDTYLYLDSYTIMDYNGNPVAPTTILAAEVVPDMPPEAVSFPVFDLNTGILSISFSEPMNSSSVDVSQFMLFSSCSSTATETYQLTGGVLTSPDSSTLNISLTFEDLNEVKLLQNLCTSVTNCIPAFNSRFGSDLTGNSVVNVSPQLCLPFEEFVVDSTPPILSSFDLDLNIGTLILTFSEPVSVNTLNPMHITLQAFPESVVMSIQLSSSAITTSGNGLVIVLELQLGDLDRIKASTQLATSAANTFLSLTSSTVQDLNGSPVVPVAPQTALPVSTFIADQTQPDLILFSLDLDFGSLQLSFSEAVVLSTLNATGIVLLNSNPSPTISFPLTGGSADAVSLTEVLLVLTRDDANHLRQLQDLATSVDDTFIAFTSPTILDYNGNPVTAIPPQSAIMAFQFTRVTPPLLKYFQLDLTNTGYLVLVFSELVDPSSFDAAAISLLSTQGIDPTSYSLTLNSSVVFTNSTTVVNVIISDTDIDALEGIPGLASNCANTFLSFTSDIIQDIGGNPAEGVESNNSLQAFKVNSVHCNPPAPVMGVWIVIINSTAVGIHWEPAQLEEFSYYIIYYYLSESTGPPEMVRVSRRIETSFTISGLIPNGTYVFQVTVTVVINGELVEGEQAEDPTIIQLPSDSDPGCPFELDAWNIQWGFTEPGTSEMQPCGTEFIGNASRECYGNSTWGETDVSSCDSRPFMELRYNAESLFGGENVDISAALALVEDLAEITVPDPDVTRSLFPSNLNTTNLILTGAVDSLLADLNQTGGADPRQSISIVEVFNNVLDEDNQAGWEALQQNNVGSQALLNNAERYALYVAMATNGTNDNISISRDNIVIQAKQVTADGRNFEDIIFPTMEELVNTSFDSSPATIRIPGSVLTERAAQSNLEVIPVANVLFRNLEKFLPSSLTVGVTDGSVLEPKSAVISSQVAVQSGSSQALKEDPAKIYFILNLEKTDTYPRCAFWDFADMVGNGAWSFEGLQSLQTDFDGNNTMIQCSSTHLTSFAILVNIGGSVRDERALTFITYIGCGVSIVCLLFSIVFFLTAGRNLFRKPHNFIHLNLCIALLLGYVLFIGGTDFAKNISWLCTTVAALLHYLFLAVFCWMLCEGIMLYLMLVVVFSKLSKRWWFFLLLGWGVPLIFVAIGLGVRLDQYGTAEYCWISTDVNGVIWFFVGPMLAVIMINVVFLILVLISLFKTLSGRAARSPIRQEKKGMSEQVRVVKKLIKAAVMILPLLGITWALGLLAVNENTLAFAYVFTVLNSLQGFFIFFFYVLRDQRLCGRRKRFSGSRRATSQVSKPGSIKKDATITKRLSDIGTTGDDDHEELLDEKPPADQAV